MATPTAPSAPTGGPARRSPLEIGVLLGIVVSVGVAVGGGIVSRAPAPVPVVVPMVRPAPPAPDRTTLDAALWRATAGALDQAAADGAWTDDQTATVRTVLQWRHQQVIVHREALAAGVGLDETEIAILATANAAHERIVAVVGPDGAEALSDALASGIGAGL